MIKEVGMTVGANRRIAENLYLSFFLILLIVKTTGFYEGQIIFNAALIISAIILMLKMLLDRYSIREYLLVASFVLLGVIVYLNTGEKGLLICFAMMLGMKGVSIRKVLVCGACVSGTIVLLKVFTGAFGLLPESLIASYRVGMGTEIRHTFGYAHPNTLQISVLALSILVTYLVTKYTEHIVIGSLVVIIFDIYVYMYSGSRTGVLACLIYICINNWLYFRNRLGVIEKIVCYCIYPVACIVTIAFPLVLPDSFFVLLDDRFFTYRLSIAKYYYAYNSVSLFGIRLFNPENIPYSLDMAYMYLFLQLGLVAFITISGLTIYCVHKAVINNKNAELAVFIGITIAGIWEPFLYNSSFKNILFVMAGVVLFGQINNNDVIKIDLGRKRILDYSVVALVTAFIFLGAYLIHTTEPKELYADVEKPVTSSDVTNTPIYLTRAEKDVIVEGGAIVLGYTDEKKPIYKYGIEVAKKEYRNRCFSMAMLGGLLGIAGFCVWNRYSRS